ncbi:uncharacterized protein EDB93DRAFT_696118 [Suillus bovinus]|uniref:uncharacterized protein n=1 Tax=Suillus bovinus TaxID=48563 RepID=UPI001B86C0E0|nr:uncharacterized protein EDB93DRAFT_696118 [Suillus bovinus]KAG2139580.1 hypothetical protein EDB93DRAFT_696118 [Suillus bovinus]
MTSARSLQFAAYIFTSIATIWTYDYICSLHEEWTFLLQSHWSKMKILYFVTRYLPFIIVAMDLYMGFAPNENQAECRVLENINPALGIVIIIFSEFFFVLRTYVLWNQNKILLAAMLSTLFCLLVAISAMIFATGVPASYATSAIPGITGCYQSSTSFLYFIPFLLLSLFELLLMILTLIRVMQDWRTNAGRLYVVLVNHNISYYACSFLFSVANIFASLLLQYSYHSVLYDFEFITLAILATRMHLHLWQTNRHPHGSTSDHMHISMSEISFVNSTA